MSVSMVELAQARELATKILDELGLDAYLFEVEPGEKQWELKVECAVEEGWETVSIPVTKELLLRITDDAAAHQLLMADWHKALSACLVKK